MAGHGGFSSGIVVAQCCWQLRLPLNCLSSMNMYWGLETLKSVDLMFVYKGGCLIANSRLCQKEEGGFLGQRVMQKDGARLLEADRRFAPKLQVVFHTNNLQHSLSRPRGWWRGLRGWKLVISIWYMASTQGCGLTGYMISDNRYHPIATSKRCWGIMDGNKMWWTPVCTYVFEPTSHIRQMIFW